MKKLKIFHSKYTDFLGVLADFEQNKSRDECISAFIHIDYFLSSTILLLPLE